MPPGDDPLWSGRFLSALVHELRTPLASLLLTAELLADDPRLKPRQARYARSVGEAAGDLRALLDDVGDLNRLRAGRVTITRAEARLAEVIESALGPLRKLAVAEGVVLEAETAPGTPATLVTDAAQLARALRNLVGSALRCGARRVELRAEARGDALHLLIVDDGAAIGAEEGARLFEPFAGTSARARRAHGGSSLALPLAAGLASLLGGRLELDSEAARPTLRLVLPLALTA
jgi:signal transduction histidine kinase